MVAYGDVTVQMIPIGIQHQHDVLDFAGLHKVLQILDKSRLLVAYVVYSLDAYGKDAVLARFFSFLLALLNDERVDLLFLKETVAHTLRNVEFSLRTLWGLVFYRFALLVGMQFRIRPPHTHVVFQPSGCATCGVLHPVSPQVIVKDKHFVVIMVDVEIHIHAAFLERTDFYDGMGGVGRVDVGHNIFSRQP